MIPYRKWASTPIEDRPATSVVIPTYNEEVRVVPTIGAIAAEMCRIGEPWELIVSDDGSTDGTVAIVRDLGLANVRVLESPNTGKGGAVRRGVQASRGRLVLFADADQSTPIEQFELLATRIADGADIAVASRHSGTETSKSLQRRAVSAILRGLTRAVYRIPVVDTQCGFKLFTAEAAATVFGRQRIDGFSFDLEVLWLGHRAGFRIDEVPVEWIDAPGSKVQPGRDGLRFLTDIARIRWWSLRGVYASAPTSHPMTVAPPITSLEERTA